MLNCRVVITGLVVMFCLAISVRGGEISGVVVYKDGSKAKRVGVSGLTSGAFGGLTKTVFTDSQGRFRLTWSSNANLAKVYLRGKVVAKNVKNKSRNVRLVIR